MKYLSMICALSALLLVGCSASPSEEFDEVVASLVSDYSANREFVDGSIEVVGSDVVKTDSIKHPLKGVAIVKFLFKEDVRSTRFPKEKNYTLDCTIHVYHKHEFTWSDDDKTWERSGLSEKIATIDPGVPFSDLSDEAFNLIHKASDREFTELDASHHATPSFTAPMSFWIKADEFSSIYLDSNGDPLPLGEAMDRYDEWVKEIRAG